MPITALIAKHFREIHFGVNWSWSNLKDQLSDITWLEATTQIDGFNTIAALVYHINYYVGAVIKVLEGGPLDASDKFSFAVPAITSDADWQAMLDKMWSEAEIMATLIEQIPDDKLEDVFVLEKYGNYYRNLHGVIEHSHYHLGQIVVLKKVLRMKQ
jgi:DinB superfamily